MNSLISLSLTKKFKFICYLIDNFKLIFILIIKNQLKCLMKNKARIFSSNRNKIKDSINNNMIKNIEKKSPNINNFSCNNQGIILNISFKDGLYIFFLVM